MAAIAALLARSEPGEGGRILDGEPLTCEALREAATRRVRRGRLSRRRPDRAQRARSRRTVMPRVPAPLRTTT